MFVESLWSPTLLCLTTAVVVFLASLFQNYRRCRQVKGTWLASVSSVWLLWSTMRSRIYLDCANILDEYGSLARIAPGKIVTNDPDLWRHMSAPRSKYRKGTWYDSMTLDSRYKNSLSQRDDEAHNLLRSKMVRGYSGKEIPDLESNIDNRICDLITLIRKQTALQKPVDVANLAQFFTLDVLTEIAFEKPFGYLEKNEDVHQYVHQVSDFLHMLELCSNFPFIRRVVFSKLMSLFQPKPTDKTGMGAMLGVSQRVVRARYAGKSESRHDMLGSFIKNGLSQNEAESEAMLQILGGSDSTATAIRMTFLYIITNPAVYVKLLREIDSARGRISEPVITSAEARTLPYLQACIKEGLRMWPPLTGLQGKVSPPGGEIVNGTFIPGGIEVCWCPLSMQHRRNIYGPDADRFRPERWLETTDDEDGRLRLSRMERTLELVFGSGKYGCLGKTVAFMEFDKVFVALMQNFDWGLVDPVSPIETVCHGVHVQTGLWMQATERAQV